MGRFGRKLTAYTMSALMLFSGMGFSDGMKNVKAADNTGETSQQIEVRECENEKAGSGNVIVELEGMDYTSAQQELLNRINQVREEACNAGNVPDPRNPQRMLQPGDCKDLVIGVNCTKVAQIRAAEGSVKFSHTRPKGGYGVDLLSDLGAVFSGENLAWKTLNESDLDQWINEKDDWIAQVKDDPKKPTGHYAALVNPDFYYVGISTFNPDNDLYISDWSCTTGAFAKRDTEISEYKPAQSEKVIQKIEIPASDITTIDIVGDSIFKIGDSYTYEPYVSAKLTSPELGKSNTVFDMPVCDGITWSTSNTSIISVDKTGTITAKQNGKATITATIGSGEGAKSVSRELIVIPEGVTVTGVNDPEMVYTDSCVTPILSKTAKAILSNGEEIEVNVEWEMPENNKLEQLLETYFTSEEFDIKGKALGFDVTQRVHVNASEVKDIYATDIKEEYYVPDRVPVVYTQCGTVPEYFDNYKTNKNAASAVVIFANQWALTEYAIDWNAEELQTYCNTPQGGTFTVHGTVKVRTDNGNVDIPIEQKLVVYSASVESVVIDETPIETLQGEMPNYPKARVTWSSGHVTNEPITWEENEGYKGEVGSSYKVKGSYTKPDGSVKEIEITVTVVSITVVDIIYDNSVINVVNGTYPTLPTKASVYWSDSSVEEKEIDWEPIPIDKYQNVDGGKFVVKGTVAGKEVSITCLVPKANITSIPELEQVETVEGKCPVLPSTVKVLWDNGTETDVKVIWEEINEEDYKTPGTTKTLTGTLKDREEKVKITFVVNSKKLYSLGWDIPQQASEGNPSGLVSYGSYDISKLKGTIVAYYDNDTKEIFDIKSDRITMSGYDEASMNESQEITFSYEYGGVKKSVKTTLQLKPYKIDSIEVTSLPIQKFNGSELNLAGVILEATYSSGEKNRFSLERLVGLGRADITGYDLSEKGKQNIVITYHDSYQSITEPGVKVDNDISFSTSITVKDIFAKEIKIMSKPEAGYIIGQTIDFSVLKVKVVYDNDVQEEIEYADFKKNDISITEYDPTKLGDQKFTISKDNISVSFAINVVDKQIKTAYFTLPNITSYLQGQYLSLKGSNLHIEYDNDVDIVDISVDDELNLASSKVKILFYDEMWNELISGGYEDIGRLSVGKYNIAISYENQAIELNNSQRLVKGYAITVKAPDTNSSASVSADDVGNVSANASIADIKAAFSGVTIEVPCKDGINMPITVTEDMVEDVKDVTEDNASSVEKILLEGVEENQVVKKIKIAITEDASGNKVYTYIYLAVQKDNSSGENGSGSGGNGSGESGSEESGTGESGTGESGTGGKGTGGNGSGGNASSDGKESGKSGDGSSTGKSGNESGTEGKDKQTTTESAGSKADKDSTNPEAAAAKVGSVVSAGGANYKVTSSDAVSYKAPTQKSATGITIPATVKIGGKTYKVSTIEANAFKGNAKLKKVVIGKNVQIVGKNAFAGCTNLTTVSLGSNVTTIGDGAFSGCKKLTKIVIPAKVKKIGKKAFYKCSNLKRVIIKTKKLGKKSIGAAAFKGINKKAVVTVPKAKKKVYTKYINKAGLPKSAKVK